MKKMPLVSVIIPTYNRAGLIASSIESVLEQSYKNLEIIVVDDGSSDNTGKIVAEYSNPVRYIYQKNSGPSAARNNGIQHACGNLIAFLDADDIWLPEKLAMQIEVIENNEVVDMVTTGYFICDPDLNIQNSVSYPPGKIARRNLLVKNTILTSSVLARKECFAVKGLFNEGYRFGEDWDMWLRIASRFSIFNIEKPCCKYRVHSANITMEMSPKNFADWHDIIVKNAETAADFREKYMCLAKSLSWFYFNLAAVHQGRGDKPAERKFLAKSLIMWPFSYYKRYLAFLRTFLKEDTYLKFRKVLGSCSRRDDSLRKAG